MKKILIAVSAAVLGIVANAASFKWEATTDWFSPDANNDLTGTVYLFDGSLTSIAVVTDALTDSLSDAIGSKALEYGTFSASGAELTDDGSNALHMFAIVINDDGDGYWASDMIDVALNDAIKGGAPARFNFGDVEDIAFTPISSGPTPPTPVPEPTSGILLVLGMAGLALRRRNA